MANLRRHVPLSVVVFILGVCHAKQSITHPTFTRKMMYNISSVAFTSSRLTYTTGSKNDACYLQCFVTPECMSFIYNSETTECRTFSALLDDPPHLTGSMVNAYFIQGSKICSAMGYVFEAAVPFCYNIHHDLVNYDDAQENCKNEGGRLIQIDSLAKQKIVNTFDLQAAVKKYRIDGELVGSTWVFSSGLKIAHLYWDEGEPTLRNSKSRFLSVFHKTNKWDDTIPTTGFGYICERMF